MKGPRADHVGSLLRPQMLLDTRKQYEVGSITLDKLREIEDRSVLDAVKMQREAGTEVVSDGEYRRGIWYGPLSEGLEGFVASPEPSPAPEASGTARLPHWHKRPWRS